MQKKRNSIDNALELCLFCIKPSDMTFAMQVNHILAIEHQFHQWEWCLMQICIYTSWK